MARRFIRRVVEARYWVTKAMALPEWYRCHRLLAAGRVDEALRITGSRRLLRWMPHIAVMRARAARDRGRPDLIRETVDFVAGLDMPASARFDIARNLARLGHPDEAGDVLLADPLVREDAAFAYTARTVLQVTRDRDRRAELRRLVDEATQGGREIKAARLERPFAGPEVTGVPPVPMGEIELVPSARLPERHIVRLREEERRTRVRLAEPAVPRLWEYRSVFLDGHGQIWTEDGAIVRTYGEPIPRVTRAEVPHVEVACHVLSRTVGIYHWLVDRLPTLAWLLRPDAPQAAVLLADDAPSFERATLALAGLDDRVVSIRSAVFVDRLIVGRVGFAGLRHWDHVAPLVDRLRERAVAQAVAAGVSLPDHVYISRRDASRRSLSNEAEVEAMAIRFGFESVLMSRIPLWHQIALASRCRSILAPHGAGLAHSLFAPRDAVIEEIMPITDASYALRFNYARLAMIRGIRYRAFVDDQPAAARTWSVDLSGLEAFLRDGRRA